jgi:hypothetical protein
MFTRITTDNPNFGTIKSQLAATIDRFDYNALAREFNSLAVGELISFPYSKGKIALLAKQFEKRGLKRDNDYTAQGREVEGQPYTVFVTRVSDRAAEILTPKPRGPRGPRKPKAPAEGGTSAAAAPATSAKGKASK